MAMDLQKDRQVAEYNRQMLQSGFQIVTVSSAKQISPVYHRVANLC
jgi:hypothetical protein